MSFSITYDQIVRKGMFVMNNRRKNCGFFQRILVTLVCLSIIVCNSKTVLGNAKYVHGQEFVILLLKVLEPDHKNLTKEESIKRAISCGLIKQSETGFLKEKVTHEMAAFYGNRTEEVIHGKAYDKELYNRVNSIDRISDLKKVSQEKRSAVVKMFMKGIMIGFREQTYSKSRKVLPDTFITPEEAKVIVARVKDKKKRRKISWDGQLIREKDLPKNKKDYKYILESYPNSFYEKKFRYELGKKADGTKMQNGIDYIKPISMEKNVFQNQFDYKMADVMDLYLERWCKKIEDNLTCRFQVDYRTINDKWINQLRSTYYVRAEGDGEDASSNKKIMDKILNYVKEVKKHEIIIKANKIMVEPSTLYYNYGFYVRAYVEFEVVSYKGNLKQDQIFFWENGYIPNLEKGKKMKIIIDLGIGSNNGSSNGEDFAIMNDYIFVF